MELSRLDRVAYRAQHVSFLVHASLLQGTARLLSRQPRPAIPWSAVRALRRRHAALHARDLANVEAGLYPRDLLFDMPIGEYARALPAFVADTPSLVRRKRRGDYHDLPAVDKSRFPAYYRRNFHWQTDGYLSHHSARIYELGVELLLGGTADVMRRQIIPPVTRFLREQPGAVRQRLLDVACGTGRTLQQLAVAHPSLDLHGIDLSPYYLERARQRLGAATLSVENAEKMSCTDGAFDVVTSLYLFHELPRNARRAVVSEMFRALRPGGLLVIEDAAQLADAAELAGALQSFPDEFHEPFFRDYLEDDLAEILAGAGFSVDAVEPHLLAKVVVARRPRS